MLVLGIESSCDESAISIVKDGQKIIINEIYSQYEIHKKFGGVFPEYASRSHLEKLLIILKNALKGSNLTLKDLNLITVSQKPGLIGSLHMGLSLAKSLSIALKIPYKAVNHIHAHLISAMIGREDLLQFPALGVTISGGHTFLALMKNRTEYSIIGSTIDDAVGEAFDKVAKLLGLGYPGGPKVEEMAKYGDPQAFNFIPCRVKNKPYNFSFSGLKTKVLYTLRGQNAQNNGEILLKKEKFKDLAASFQMCALTDILKKSIKACIDFNLKQVFLGGGVANNHLLRQLFDRFSPPTLKVFFPQKGLCEDNGAMIAALGFYQFMQEGIESSLNLNPQPTSKLTCI